MRRKVKSQIEKLINQGSSLLSAYNDYLDKSKKGELAEFDFSVFKVWYYDVKTFTFKYLKRHPLYTDLRKYLNLSDYNELLILLKSVNNNDRKEIKKNYRTEKRSKKEEKQINKKNTKK